MPDIPDDVLVAARRAALPQYETDMESYARVLSGEADTWPVVKVAIRAIMTERDRSAVAMKPFIAMAKRLERDYPGYGDHLSVFFDLTHGDFRRLQGSVDA